MTNDRPQKFRPLCPACNAAALEVKVMGSPGHADSPDLPDSITQVFVMTCPRCGGYHRRFPGRFSDQAPHGNPPYFNTISENVDGMRLVYNATKPVVELRYRPARQKVREWVGPCDYIATLLGWHNGQTPGLADTAEEALADFAAKHGESLDSLRKKARVTFIGCDPLPGWDVTDWTAGYQDLRYLTEAEVAAHLGIAAEEAAALRAELRAFRHGDVWRIDPAELTRYVESTNPGTPTNEPPALTS